MDVNDVEQVSSSERNRLRTTLLAVRKSRWSCAHRPQKDLLEAVHKISPKSIAKSSGTHIMGDGGED